MSPSGAGHLTLIGFMGCGKTSVGRELARELGRALVDLDKAIEEKEGTTIAEMFRIKGEGAFRERERECLKETLAREEPLVICSGGGIVLDPRNVQDIKEKGAAVWLRARPETIRGRLAGDATRPLLKDGMSVERIAEMLGKRLPLYRSAADLAVDTDGKAPAEIAAEIAGALGRVAAAR